MAPTATATAASLPDDLLVEILLHLPAKSVLRFRAVCKSWRRLFSDPAFVRDHHRRAPLALLLKDSRTAYNRDAIYALPFPYTDQSTAASLYCGIASSRETYVEGCCDGLLLLDCSGLWLRELDADGNEYRYYVCNPATRELATLPTDRDGIDYVGFYRHAPTAEYRVLGYKYASSSTDTEDHYEYLVAVPGQERARELVSTSVWMPDVNSMLYSAPVIHRGCLHWMAWPPSHGAVVFDTISEEFRPDAGMDLRTGQIVGVDGTLGTSVFVKPERTLKVWVLESYQEEAWALRYNIDVGFLDQGFLSSVLVAHVSDEGDALLVPSERKRVGVYNLRWGTVVSAGRDPFRCNLHGTEHVYQESLVSPATKVSVTQLHNLV